MQYHPHAKEEKHTEQTHDNYNHLLDYGVYTRGFFLNMVFCIFGSHSSISFPNEFSALYRAKIMPARTIAIKSAAALSF